MNRLVLSRLVDILTTLKTVSFVRMVCSVNLLQTLSIKFSWNLQFSIGDETYARTSIGRQFLDDEHRDGPWNIRLLATPPPDAVAGPRTFYWIHRNILICQWRDDNDYDDDRKRELIFITLCRKIIFALMFQISDPYIQIWYILYILYIVMYLLYYI
jgi:hypothetical protein